MKSESAATSPEPAAAHLTRGLARALYNEGRVLEGVRPGHAALLLAAADALDAAHRGLLRALDYRAGSPEALDIKADVRSALHRSGFEGPMGVQGS